MMAQRETPEEARKRIWGEGQPELRKTRRILGFEITRAPRSPRHDYFHVRVAAFIGLLSVIGHEVIYRQAGGDDFELGRTISHAGADMFFFVVVPIVFVLVLIEAGRIL